MKTIALFDIFSYRKRIASYVVLVVVFGFGIFGGNTFNMSLGEGVFLNSPFTIGFLTGFLSLSIIFVATVIGAQLLFKEEDSRFNLLIFSTSVTERNFLLGRFLSFFFLTFLVFSFFFLGFVLGQIFRSGEEVKPGFEIGSYLYPYFVFGVLNCFLVCSFLFFFSVLFKQKMVLVLSGLLLYIIYMVALLFSNSPIMSNSMPQSVVAQKISTVLDLFGLSAYLFEGINFGVVQKNTIVVPLSGYFLFNRIFIFLLSAALLLFSARIFSFTLKTKNSTNRKRNEISIVETKISNHSFIKINSNYSFRNSITSIFSFTKIDLVEVFKSIAFAGSVLLLLFAIGMEMFAEIEKNIRMPQKYASSGLMAMTIIENFHLLGILLVAYFANELFWRSQSSRFSLIENSTHFSFNKLIGHWFSVNILVLVYSLILVVEGIFFQLAYDYPFFEFNAYFGVFVFNAFPMILFGGFVLLINLFVKNKYISLAISILCGIFFATVLSKKIFENPLFRFFSGFNGDWSDFNGFGIYSSAFLERSLFGFGLIAMVWLIYYFVTNKNFRIQKIAAVFLLVVATFFSGKFFLNGYENKNQEALNEDAANYEKQFKVDENLPQPTIKSVKTDIQLFPRNRSYHIKGTYQLKNISGKNIKKILLNVDENMKMKNFTFKFKNQIFHPNKNVQEIILKSEMLPGETATLNFEMTYQWFPANGHQSFNAIIENGSFMRISRYYPTFGYQKDYEITDENVRKSFHLGKQSPIKKLEEPKTNPQDFVDLEMTVSTSKNQTAVGTGDFVKSWSSGERNYFHFSAKQIPLRFAVSSAVYETRKINHRGIEIEVFYHKKHAENVQHLIENAKITYDYCTENFGNYPFKKITFAEISSFTKGFNATAYPSVIFMTENGAFHADLSKQKNQDVINELAGHELSHIWWGNSQISPDDREGAPMLTETLAMYTEMMIYKKLHGKEKMLERLKVHEQIYDEEKGYSKPQPLYKVTAENPHISYSKGAIVMVKLSEILGEHQLNEIMKNFLKDYKYPQRPTTLDFLNEMYKFAPKDKVKEIDSLFKTEY